MFGTVEAPLTKASFKVSKPAFDIRPLALCRSLCANSIYKSFLPRFLLQIAVCRRRKNLKSRGSCCRAGIWSKTLFFHNQILLVAMGAFSIECAPCRAMREPLSTVVVYLYTRKRDADKRIGEKRRHCRCNEIWPRGRTRRGRGRGPTTAR